MRKRYQKGGIKKVGQSWVAQWWEEGHRRNKTLGRVSEMIKSEAQAKLSDIVAPLNRPTEPSGAWRFEDFVTEVYLPLYKRKWKGSTLESNEDRIGYHLLASFEDSRLDSFKRTSCRIFSIRKPILGCRLASWITSDGI